MSPIDVVIWSCVAIFIVTSLLTLLHVSGIRPLPNPEHGKTLFRALVVEIVIIAVAAFGSTLMSTKHETKEKVSIGSGIPKGLDPPLSTGGAQERIKPGVPEQSNSLKTMADSISKKALESLPIERALDEGCSQVTFTDGSVYPSISRIETLCEK